MKTWVVSGAQGTVRTFLVTRAGSHLSHAGSGSLVGPPPATPSSKAGTHTNGGQAGSPTSPQKTCQRKTT